MKKEKIKLTPDNLNLVIRYAHVIADCNPNVYSDEQIAEITKAIAGFSEEIALDRTYVASENSKYSKTFITPEGWEALCQLLNKTKYGSHATKKQNATLLEAYQMLIIQYMYQALADLGYDIAEIYLEIKQGTSFMTEIH